MKPFKQLEMSFHDQRQMALSLSLRRINKTIVQLKKSQKYNNSISYDYTNVTSTLFTVSEIYSNFLNSKYCFCIGPEECSHKYGTEIFNNVFFIIQRWRFIIAGIQRYPQSTSVRCIFFFWWIFTILIVSIYTANLAAFLTVTIVKKPVNSRADLLAQEALVPLVMKGTALYSRIMVSFVLQTRTIRVAVAQWLMSTARESQAFHVWSSIPSGGFG